MKKGEHIQGAVYSIDSDNRVLTLYGAKMSASSYQSWTN